MVATKLQIHDNDTYSALGVLLFSSVAKQSKLLIEIVDLIYSPDT